MKKLLALLLTLVMAISVETDEELGMMERRSIKYSTIEKIKMEFQK
jgi:hypothetical protein